ncbi:glycoside hydrolase family 3 protein [Periconia macrospinosa]|uniref:xylan 1,4-beta-xylosidase n=1 Tax=Periconia macrospinosa TaxID=97972 RepID=A0A2V1D797_9PLEO|nr:glycoside hydrolase family 3 protein [Periconia macrospinosa]
MKALKQLISLWPALILAQNASNSHYPSCTTLPLRDNPVCDESLDPAARAAGLVAAMNISEKLVILIDHSPGIPRLGIPAYDWWGEALHGVAYSPAVRFAMTGEFSSATSFANPITISAAFDDELVERVGKTIGVEARAFANAGRAGLDFWTPNINPFKDPRWGRGLETPGEDAFRVSQYVKHLLRGMEWASEEPSETRSRHIIATCKHFASYDLERWEGIVRQKFDAQVRMQDLVEYYLPSFRQCARDSNVGSIMCAYNRVNGTPACADSYMMQTVLREHWGWTKHGNYIVSDCNAVKNIWADHNWTSTAAQAAGKAFTAGMDNVCEVSRGSTDVIGAFNQSLVSEEVIDTSLKRQFEGLVRAGYFQKSPDPTGFRSYGWNSVNTDAAANLAKQSATDGITLLKNDGILPVQFKKNQTVAIIGMWANDTQNRMLGNYFGRPPYYRSPLWAARQLNISTLYANGPVSNTTFNQSAAIEAARSSDTILYFGGIDGSIEAEDLDRTEITWPAPQLSLLSALSKLGKPIIVVQLGTSLDNSPLLDNPSISAIVWAGYPGMYGGPAVFDILTGVKAPAGRLPITQYPAEYAKQVNMTDMTLRPSQKSPGRTYRWYDQAVQEFGYGLGYSNFSVKFGGPWSGDDSKTVAFPSLGNTECGKEYRDLCAFPQKVPVLVKNEGKITSDYSVLIFAKSEAGPKPWPKKSLVAYQRLRDIKPGEEREVEFELTVGSFSRVLDNGDSILYDGEYCLVWEGGLDGGDGEEQACLEIAQGEGGGLALVDRWPQPKPANATLGA